MPHGLSKYFKKRNNILASPYSRCRKPWLIHEHVGEHKLWHPMFCASSCSCTSRFFLSARLAWGRCVCALSLCSSQCRPERINLIFARLEQSLQKISPVLGQYGLLLLVAVASTVSFGCQRSCAEFCSGKSRRKWTLALNMILVYFSAISALVLWLLSLQWSSAALHVHHTHTVPDNSFLLCCLAAALLRFLPKLLCRFSTSSAWCWVRTLWLCYFPFLWSTLFWNWRVGS